MRRTFPITAVLLALAACQAGPEAQRTTLPPMLPDKVTAMPYGTLLQRARAQTKKATEAFYVDNWSDLEEAARGLEQTAQYMAKADDVPAKHKDTLVTASGDLGKLAGELRKAATAKDVKKTTDVLTKVQLKVREMRLGGLKMPTPIEPFWFKQRQCKAEPHGGGEMLKVSGPNLAEAYIHVRNDGGQWLAGLRTRPDGPDVAIAEAQVPTETAAWSAAFELYRQHVIV